MLAGVDGRASSRQTVEHNLIGTLNVLEYCKARGAGLVLLSTSRVYSIRALTALPLDVRDRAFVPHEGAEWPAGASPRGIIRILFHCGTGLAVRGDQAGVRGDCR